MQRAGSRVWKAAKNKPPRRPALARHFHRGPVARRSPPRSGGTAKQKNQVGAELGAPAIRIDAWNAHVPLIVAPHPQNHLHGVAVPSRVRHAGLASILRARRDGVPPTQSKR